VPGSGAARQPVGRVLKRGAERLRLDCAALDTALGALHRSRAPVRISSGARLTRGLGAGGNPRPGERAVEQSADELFHLCRRADAVLIAAGLGGGAGTGAAAQLAALARACAALTVALASSPFAFEGTRRRHRCCLCH
jgi:cell division protein FtsZ